MRYILLVVTIILLGAGVFLLLPGEEPERILHVTVVETPAQSAPAWPPAIANPLENRPPLPDTTNLAHGRPATAGTQIYMRPATNAVDGSINTFWESARLPAMFTLDMESIYEIATIAVALNPLWESRSQVFEILGSVCGEDFFEIAESAVHFFSPRTANTVRIDFPQVYAKYIRLVFTSNTALYTNGAQLGEIMVFGLY